MLSTISTYTWLVVSHVQYVHFVVKNHREPWQKPWKIIYLVEFNRLLGYSLINTTILFNTTKRLCASSIHSLQKHQVYIHCLQLGIDLVIICSTFLLQSALTDADKSYDKRWMLDICEQRTMRRLYLGTVNRLRWRTQSQKWQLSSK